VANINPKIAHAATRPQTAPDFTEPFSVSFPIAVLSEGRMQK
jgi:hypothetical protein